MARILAFLTLLAALAGAAPWLVPVAKQSVRLIEARDDPARLADLGLAGFDAPAAEQAMREALAADDPVLAGSFLELADARGLAVPAALRAEVTAANGATASAMRSARDFGAGFITGDPQDLAGLAGAAVGDLMVWGDIRDASREGLKLARGEDPDQLILGLSAVGLAVTAGTYATTGASLPLRAGITLVKVAKRTGHLSVALGRVLTRAVRESVDFAALGRLARAPGTVDGAVLKGVVRSDRLAGLGRMLDDVATVQSKAGTRAALEGLKVADSGRDLGRVARLAEAKGGQTLAILKTLGRGALVITGALLKLVWWVFLGASYLYLLVSSFNAFCVACARPLWRRKARRRARWTLPAFPGVMVREPRRPARGPEPSATPPEGAAQARFDAAVRAARALAEGAGTGGGQGWQRAGEPLGSRSLSPAGAPERREEPREEAPCPISIPTASTSPISTRGPASRSS